MKMNIHRIKNCYIKQLQQYNEVISKYYKNRTNGKREDTWTEQMAKMLNRPTRMYMKEFIQNNRLDLK